MEQFLIEKDDGSTWKYPPQSAAKLLGIPQYVEQFTHHIHELQRTITRLSNRLAVFERPQNKARVCELLNDGTQGHTSNWIMRRLGAFVSWRQLSLIFAELQDEGKIRYYHAGKVPMIGLTKKELEQ